jgi:hypothetical protein
MFFLGDIKEGIDPIAKCSSFIAQNSGHKKTSEAITTANDLYSFFDTLKSLRDGVKAASAIHDAAKGIGGFRNVKFRNILKADASRGVGQMYFKASQVPVKLIKLMGK